MKNLHRELKFRAWDSKAKKMWSDGSSAIYMILKDSIDGGMLVCKEGIHLMQFTGLKDKNLKEIYEGDIVRTFIMDTGPVPLEVLSSIIFCEGMVVVFALNGEPLSLRDAIKISNKTGRGLEVIGNIWENPDLIK